MRFLNLSGSVPASCRALEKFLHATLYKDLCHAATNQTCAFLERHFSLSTAGYLSFSFSISLAVKRRLFISFFFRYVSVSACSVSSTKHYFAVRKCAKKTIAMTRNHRPATCTAIFMPSSLARFAIMSAAYPSATFEVQFIQIIYQHLVLSLCDRTRFW